MKLNIYVTLLLLWYYYDLFNYYYISFFGNYYICTKWRILGYIFIYCTIRLMFMNNIFIKSILLSCLLLLFTNNFLSLYLSLEIFSYSVIFLLFSNLRNLKSAQKPLTITFKERNKDRDYICKQRENTFNTFTLKERECVIGVYGSYHIPPKETKEKDNIWNYFIINSFSTLLFLYALFYCYYINGSFLINEFHYQELYFFLFITYIFFKISNYPYHYYTYDFYPKNVLSSLKFIYTLPTLFYIYLLYIILQYPIFKLQGFFFFYFSIFFTILMSIIICFTNSHILKFLVFSSLLNISFILISYLYVLNSPTHNPTEVYTLFFFDNTFLYIISYIISIIPFISIIQSISFKGYHYYQYLSILAHKSVSYFIPLFIIICSFIGLPPTLGFFSKFFLLFSLFLATPYNIFSYGFIYLFIIASFLSLIFYLYPFIFFHTPKGFSPSSNKSYFHLSYIISLLISFLLYGIFYLPYLLSILIF